MTMTKPIIGILGNILETKSVVSGSIVNRSYTNDACVRSIANNGGVPMILPFVKDPTCLDPLFALCDGMLFPGGGDVDPTFYGEEPMEGLMEVDRAMDELWLRAARYAMERRLPVLGICRGAQVLNVAFGGTLYQDIHRDFVPSQGKPEKPLEHVQKDFRHVTTQRALIEPGTRLARILGETTVPINSMHHQAVKAPGRGVIVSAHAEDSVIEGIESPDGLLVAVQWHPEDLIDSAPAMNKLFQDLMERAQEHRSE